VDSLLVFLHRTPGQFNWKWTLARHFQVLVRSPLFAIPLLIVAMRRANSLLSTTRLEGRTTSPRNRASSKVCHRLRRRHSEQIVRLCIFRRTFPPSPGLADLSSQRRILRLGTMGYFIAYAKVTETRSHALQSHGNASNVRSTKEDCRKK
jgi:hypothetical protein